MVWGSARGPSSQKDKNVPQVQTAGAHMAKSWDHDGCSLLQVRTLQKKCHGK